MNTACYTRCACSGCVDEIDIRRSRRQQIKDLATNDRNTAGPAILLGGCDITVDIKKKVIFVAGGRVFPVRSGGQRRSAMLIQGLRQLGYEVIIYALSDRKSVRQQDQEHDANELVFPSKLFTLINRIGFRLRLPPFWYVLILKLWMPKQLQSLIASADIIIADFPFTYSAMQTSRGLRILSTHNIEHVLETSPLRRLFIRPLVHTIELKAAQSADLIVSCCDADASFFRQLKSVRADTIIVPNGLYPTPAPPNLAKKLAARQILGFADNKFVGLFPASAYGPNKEGLDFLRNFIGKNPDLLNTLGIEIVVVGSVCSERHSSYGLNILGSVPDITPYFAGADFLINPIYHGSGTSIKVAEGIAARLPLLTTVVGARGYNLTDGESAIFFDQESLVHGLQSMSILTSKCPEQAAKLQVLTDKAWRDNAHLIAVDKALNSLHERLQQHVKPIPQNFRD